MKHVILIIICISQTSAFAQISSVGAGLGGSVSNFNYQTTPSSVQNIESNDKVGATGGIKLDYDFNESGTLKLSPEIFIIQNGSKQYYSSLQSVQKDILAQTIKLDYVGMYLPFSIYLPFDENENYVYNGFKLSISSYIDYTIQAKEIDGNTENISFKRNSEKFDLGISVSGGFIYNSIYVQFGYNWGLKNIEFYSPTTQQTQSDNEIFSINNKGFTVSLAYLIKTREY